MPTATLEPRGQPWAAPLIMMTPSQNDQPGPMPEARGVYAGVADLSRLSTGAYFKSEVRMDQPFNSDVITSMIICNHLSAKAHCKRVNALHMNVLESQPLAKTC